jgi:hypothetical protein
MPKTPVSKTTPEKSDSNHAKLRYQDLNTGEKRTVSVPLYDELVTGTLKNIAEQAGAEDFQEFLDAIDDLM